jgi:hypothetical protein
MKKYNIFILLAAVIFFLCSSSISAFADEPNPPIVPGGHGQAGDVPVGAPIDGGLSILLILGAGYGAKKLYSLRDVKTGELIK